MSLRYTYEVKVVVYILKLFVKGGSIGILAARAWLAHDLARTHARLNWSDPKFQGKVAWQNTWKYSVKL